MTNGRAHLSSLLTKWLVFLMSTIKGKVSLLLHYVYSLLPSKSIDVCLHLIIEPFCWLLSSSRTTLSHSTRLMSNCFLFCHVQFYDRIPLALKHHCHQLSERQEEAGETVPFKKIQMVHVKVWWDFYKCKIRNSMQNFKALKLTLLVILFRSIF